MLKNIKRVLAIFAVAALALALFACGDTEAEVYTVSFDSAGGSQVAPQQVEDGKTAETPEPPTRQGYDFVCWLLSGEEYSFDTPVSADITLTASWVEQAPTVNITYVFSDGSSESVTVERGSAFAEREHPEKEGFTFDGWYTAEGNLATSELTLTSSITVTASLYDSGLSFDGGRVVSYSGDAKRVEIPERVRGVAITEIGDDAFRGSRITGVTIPDSVTVISDSAFFGCDNLASIKLPRGLTTLGKFAFYNCTFLESVTVPATVTSIGIGCFGQPMRVTELGNGLNAATTVDSRLTEITLPFIGGGTAETEFFAYIFGAESPDDNWFSDEGREYTLDGEQYEVSLFYIVPSNLRTVTVSSAEPVAERAFYNCYYLEKVNFTSAVTEIGDSAFENSFSLDVTGLSAVEIIGDRAFTNTSYTGEVMLELKVIGDLAFAYTALESIILPQNLETIGSGAFAYTYLTKITIPEQVEYVGGSAFHGCNELAEVYFESPTPPSLGSDLFVWVDTDGTAYYSELLIFVPDSAGSLTPYRDYRSDVNLRTYASMVFPESVKGKTGFITEGNLLLGFIPDGENSLGEVLTVPDGVKKIDDFAFYGNPEIEEICLPEGFEVIGRYAFYNCTSVARLYMPDSMKEIDDYAFAGFFVGNNLSRLYFPEGFKRIGDGAFLSSFNLKIVELPSTLEYLGYLSFGMSNSLERMYFKSSTPPTVGTYTNDVGDVICEVFSIVNTGKTVIYVPNGREGGVSITDLYRSADGFVNVRSYIKTTPEGAEVGHYGDGVLFVDLDGGGTVTLYYIREADEDTSDMGGSRYEYAELVGSYTIDGINITLDFPDYGVISGVYNNRTVGLSIEGSTYVLKEPKYYYDSYNWTNFTLYPSGKGAFDMYGSFLTPFEWQIDGDTFKIVIDGNNKLPENAEYAGAVEYIGTYDASLDAFTVSFMLNDYGSPMDFTAEINNVVFATGEQTRLIGTYRAYDKTSANPDYPMFTIVSYGNGVLDFYIGESAYTDCTYTVTDGRVAISFMMTTIYLDMDSNGNLSGQIYGINAFFTYEDELIDSTKMPGSEDNG